MTADPVEQLALILALILVGSRVAGAAFGLIGQPAVLGELVFGIAVGNLGLVGVHGFERLLGNPIVETLGGLGLILLLFEIGLESTVAQMAKVGLRSLLVALVGVAAPFALGWAASALLLPRASPYVHAFVGATLTATSVGITARVLADLQQQRSRAARLILGAAVIDDVLGLLVLAVMAGVVGAAARGTRLSGGEIAIVVGKASGFLVGALVAGVFLSQRIFTLAARLKTSGTLISLGLGFCFVLSALAALVGLAPIVGAFAAGLILEDAHDRPFVERGEKPLHELVRPLVQVLSPLFFFGMGLHTDLRSFASPVVLGLGGALIATAIAGKLAVAAVAGPGVSRLTVAIGMVPRGEVGLVFANLGRALTLDGVPLVSAEVYAALLLMVVTTTLVTPPALRWSLSREVSP